MRRHTARSLHTSAVISPLHPACTGEDPTSGEIKVGQQRACRGCAAGSDLVVVVVVVDDE